MRQQVVRLLAPGYIARTPWERLQHLPRYLKGAGLRLEKLRADPARDATRARELAPLETAFRREVAAQARHGALPAEDAPPPALKGIEALRDAWKRLPTKPGVYRMIGSDGEVLYVGKAKSLKNRVGQYAQGRGHTNAIYRMIHQTVSLEVIVTNTETEALLLETNMIKRLRPRYNVLMRDDKSFPFIAIRTDHAIPALQKHRGAKSFKGKFYGPFASAGAVNRTLNTLQKAFLLRSCSDSTFSGRTRPCMLYQIKRCSAPCTGLVSDTEYAALVKDSADFLEGRSSQLQERLALEMRDSSDKLEFEHAARLRNRIRALASVRASQGINPHTFQEADVFALHCEGGQSCVQVFFFRAGQNWGNRAYFPRHGGEEQPAEVLGAFIAQFYDDREPPKLILCNVEPVDHQLLEDALCLRADCKVEIRTPERGEKKEIVDAVLLNAREALGRREIAGRRRRSVRLGATARADRSLRQFPHPRNERARRHDCRRPRGLREEPVPQIQHESGRVRRRRLRHDESHDPKTVRPDVGGAGRNAERNLLPCGEGGERQRAG